MVWIIFIEMIEELKSSKGVVVLVIYDIVKMFSMVGFEFRINDGFENFGI